VKKGNAYEEHMPDFNQPTVNVEVHHLENGASEAITIERWEE
jgi:hypothetical protein